MENLEVISWMIQVYNHSDDVTQKQKHNQWFCLTWGQALKESQQTGGNGSRGLRRACFQVVSALQTCKMSWLHHMVLAWELRASPVVAPLKDGLQGPISHPPNPDTGCERVGQVCAQWGQKFDTTLQERIISPNSEQGPSASIKNLVVLFFPFSASSLIGCCLLNTSQPASAPMAEHSQGNNLLMTEREQITSNHGCFREYQMSICLHPCTFTFLILVVEFEPGDLFYAKQVFCHWTLSLVLHVQSLNPSSTQQGLHTLQS